MLFGVGAGEVSTWFGVIVGYRLQFHLDGPAFVPSADSLVWLFRNHFLKCMSALCGLWFALKGCC